MKKYIISLAVLILVVIACQNSGVESVSDQQITSIDMSDFYVQTFEPLSKSSGEDQLKKCYTMNVLNRKLKENPGLEKRMFDIELHTRKAISTKGNPGGGGGKPPKDPPPPVPYEGSVTIPVIFNIIETSAGNVTQAQINSQLAVLNEDYNNNNPNTADAPSVFAGLVADCDITFTNAGVNRIVSSRTSWGTNDEMKYASSGGIDASDPSTYLNIWVCEIGGGILGYAQFPGGSPETDGVVIGTDYFGETSGEYGDGRTATHEVGHWLNLRHIWGDGRCRQDDFVSDTPSSDRPNYGCPAFPTVHCKSTDMTMNYMDYVYDSCMYMFTVGQNDRIRALFAEGGAKESFVN